MKKTLVVTLTVLVALTSVFQVAVASAPKVDDNEMPAAGQSASTVWLQLEPTKGTFRQSQPVTSTTTVTGSAVTGSAVTVPTATVPTATVPITLAGGITPSLGQILPVSTALTESVSLTAPTAPEGTDPALDEQYSEILAGTIIANRSEVSIRFFVEGQTYEVAPLRSVGIALPRETAVLNLFNCEAARSEREAGCFWDPYLVTRDGFYEVLISQQLGTDVVIVLRAAMAPPANQIWIQNRTGERESVIVNNELYEIAPAAVQEFAVELEGPVIVQLRSCIGTAERTVCEWVPQGVEAGFYYGLVHMLTPGPQNTQLTSVMLQGILASSGETIQPPPQAICRLRVPTLNVRSGPGLEFPIIAKVRSVDNQPGSVVVVAFDGTKSWMQVTERVAQDGWVTASPEFIVCEGPLAELPVLGQPVAAALPEPTATPLPPTPEPVMAAPPPATAVPAALPPATDVPAAPPPAVVEVAEPTALPSPEVVEVLPPPVPDGLARLIVNNGFDQVVRFTLDLRYRPEGDHPASEWDLEPGASATILVYPGTVAFSVSSAWRGLSGNAELLMENQEERSIWLYFVPDPGEENRWILQY
ncbi:MAG: SH3 domain-containing protein [Chloroflexi bacterium]|nr:SH3 domain-containing protein [Chloroflexota bacterium]